jgi:hypothetical protein
MLRITMLGLAFIFFLLAGFNVPQPRVNLGWLGLAALTVAAWLHS